MTPKWGMAVRKREGRGMTETCKMRHLLAGCLAMTFGLLGCAKGAATSDQATVGYDAGFAGSGDAAGASGAGGQSGAGGAGGASGSGGQSGSGGVDSAVDFDAGDGSTGSDAASDATSGGACDDLTKNGDETDVDCGGSCGGCLQGQACMFSADCDSKSCVNKKCVVAECTDCCKPKTMADCGSCTGTLPDGCGMSLTCGADSIKCFTYTPSNFDPADAAIDAKTAPAVTLSCDVTFDGVNLGADWCGGTPPQLVDQANQVVLVFSGLTINAGKTLKLTGAKPVVLVVYGDASIAGTIDASAAGATSGAGGNVTCTGASGNAGNDDTGVDKGAGGGGGGSFANKGGAGGKGDNGANGASASNTIGEVTLVPLRGGCAGGAGGKGSAGSTPGAGGGAGGAVQLTVAGDLTVAATAVIAAAGGRGQPGNTGEDAGGGGGSGGAVLIEGDKVTITSGAKLTANGGGGASGNRSNNVDGAAGSDGSKTANTVANGGAATNNVAGVGGKGAAGATAATVGADAICEGGALCFGSIRGAAGGGGGGAIGRVRVNATSACMLAGTFSPAASKNAGCP
jgi:hypothetical protein